MGAHGRRRLLRRRRRRWRRWGARASRLRRGRVVIVIRRRRVQSGVRLRRRLCGDEGRVQRGRACRGRVCANANRPCPEKKTSQLISRRFVSRCGTTSTPLMFVTSAPFVASYQTSAPVPPQTFRPLHPHIASRAAVLSCHCLRPPLTPPRSPCIHRARERHELR
jgi:hypothetical protein